MCSKEGAELLAKELDELEQTVQTLIEKFGYCKVNLIHSDGMGEGIWAVPADQRSRDRIDSDASSGEIIVVRLCNQPLGWYGRRWGDEIVAETQGDCRPVARILSQNLLEGYFLDNPPVDA